MTTTRRGFLGTSGAAVLAAGTMAHGTVFGANDRVRVACVGIRGRGWAHANAIMARDDAEVVALCDVDRDVLKSRGEEFKQKKGVDAKLYEDYRELVADDSIDAVSIATPNHWHVLAAIWALQAGKDVYVEKPISHTVWEGRQLANAVARTGRVLQHGTQRRSEPYWPWVVNNLKSGVIGEIYMVRAGVHRIRDPFNNPPAEDPPANLNWKLWQGPAPERPFSRNYVHYDWHWFWHYGNGEIGNNGPHRTDIVNWVLDKGLPVEIHSNGGIYGYKDDARETPNTQMAIHKFADGTLLTIDIRNRFSDPLPGVAFYGSEGYMVDGRFFDKDRKEINLEGRPESVNGTPLHFDNFIKAVRASDPGAVHATAEQGHVAASLCHLSNISYRLGRSLKFDPATEQFEGDAEANALLTREYRAGFAVPEIT